MEISCHDLCKEARPVDIQLERKILNTTCINILICFGSDLLNLSDTNLLAQFGTRSWWK